MLPVASAGKHLNDGNRAKAGGGGRHEIDWQGGKVGGINFYI